MILRPDRHVDAPAPPSGAALTLQGAAAALDPSGVLFLPGFDTLVVSDLHFEKGSFFAALGQPLPPYDTAATLDRLEAVIARYRPRRVVSLGDGFHDLFAGSRMAPADRARLIRLTAALDWIWILGNHDPAPPMGLGGRAMPVLRLGPLTLCHEPGTAGAGEIAGHLHPAAAVRVRGRRVRRRCFVSDGARLVMPAFGAFTGGLDVLAAPFGPLFPRGFTAWFLGEQSVYPIDRARLMR